MTDSDQSAAERERRRNLALRALVDEMLGKVRDASRRSSTSTWEPGEREHAELVLAEIMARVREEALRRRAGEGGEGGSGGDLDIDVPARPRSE